MRKIAIILLTGIICWSCDINSPDPHDFDYTLKSAEVISTNNGFGIELLQTIIEEEEAANLMISPSSIALALGMVYNGAETETKEAFEDVLNYEGLTREEINTINKDLIATLSVDTRKNLLEIANSIWYRENFQVYPAFIDINQNYFDAEVRELDFAGPDALETINSWVDDKTHGKIDKILESIDSETMMILLNALYFKCDWEIEFDKKNTEPKPFYNEDGSKYADVDMMYVEDGFAYAETEDFEAIQLPYKDGKFSMYLFLPTEGTSTTELLDELDGDTWDSWIEMFEYFSEAHVTMPKFKFDYKRSIKDDLGAMGLGVAFSDTADFSSISDVALFISNVIHKTYIDVNEEGTEAAAVTAITMDVTSIGPDGTVTITFDRPFLFAITEKTSKSIVFMGRVMEPGY